MLSAHGSWKPFCERGETCPGPRAVKHDPSAYQGCRNSAQYQIRIGDGRLGSAVWIAHGAGLGASALGPDLEVSFARNPGNRASAGANGLDVEHGGAHGKVPDCAAVGHMWTAGFDQAEIRRGAAGVERHHFREACDLCNHGAAERARGRTRQRGRDRFLHDLLCAGNAAARLHHQKRLLYKPVAECLMHASQIALHVRLDKNIDQSGDRTFVFTIFRQHGA